MNEELAVLKTIHTALARLDPKVVGDVSVDEDPRRLTLLDGKLEIEASILHEKGQHPSVAHVHVNSKMVSWPDAPLEACVVGVSDDREQGLAQAGSTWVTMVGAPILSLCHAVEIGDAVHFCGEEEWGVRGCHGFAGPAVLRFADPGELDLEAISRSAMFDYVAELAPGGLLHIAKSTISHNGKKGWKRQLEIDGHGAAYVDEDWQCGIPVPASGHVTISRFAVFHYADRPDSAAERQALDDAIAEYVKALRGNPSSSPADVVDVLVERGHRADCAYWVGHFAPLAFGRVLLTDLGVQFPDTFYLVQRHGCLSEPRELMRNPVFARAQALGWHFLTSPEHRDGFRRAAMWSAEFSALNDALNAGSRPEDLAALPPLIPDLGTTEEDVTKALEDYVAQHQAQRRTQPQPAQAKRSHWWQFWK